MSNLSILESEFIKPARPYSQNELKFMRNNLYKSLNLGDTKIYHTKCYHFYNVKKNSRKEKEIKERNKNENIGNCSVCWKLSKTPKHLKDIAFNMVNVYCDKLYNEPENYSYNFLDIENVFYKWLYLENYNKEKNENLDEENN
jgi:hypothetical protein